MIANVLRRSVSRASWASCDFEVRGPVSERSVRVICTKFTIFRARILSSMETLD
jgi:hypothetical protein